MGKRSVRSVHFVMVKNDMARCCLKSAPASVYCERILFNALDDKRLKDGEVLDFEFDVDKILCGKKPKESDMDLLKDVCRELIRCWIEEESEDDSKFNALAVFSRLSVDMKKRTILIKMNDEIKDYIVSFKEQFTKIPLQIFCSLSSLYSQRMYRLLKSHTRHGCIRRTKENLYEYLSVPEFAKESTKRFNDKILKPAIKEINEKTDLTVMFKPIKKGRNISSYHFDICDRERLDQRQKEDTERRKRIAMAKSKKAGTKEDIEYEEESGMSHSAVCNLINGYGL